MDEVCSVLAGVQSSLFHCSALFQLLGISSVEDPSISLTILLFPWKSFDFLGNLLFSLGLLSFLAKSLEFFGNPLISFEIFLISLGIL